MDEETNKIEVILDQADMDRVWRWTDARLVSSGGGEFAFYQSLKEVATIKHMVATGAVSGGGLPPIETTMDGDSLRVSFEGTESRPGVTGGIARR